MANEYWRLGENDLNWQDVFEAANLIIKEIEAAERDQYRIDNYKKLLPQFQRQKDELKAKLESG